ncbi:MAG: LOG family protein [Acidimicrobiia bacterium]
MNREAGVAVFGSSQTEPGSTEWEEAHRAGARIAGAGFTVITGGYGGTMEAVSSGAAEAGGHVIGVTAPVLFPNRSTPNPYVHEVIEASSLANRIDIMMQRSDATLALPGSIGTAAELLISWNTNHILRQGGATPRVSVAVGPGWKALARALVDMAGAFEDDLVWVDTVDEGVDWILGPGD